MPKPRKKPITFTGPDIERRAKAMVREKFPLDYGWDPSRDGPHCTCRPCAAYRVVLKTLKGG